MYDDLCSPLGRLDRIGNAIELACISLSHHHRTDVRDGLVATCEEAIRIGHAVTRIVWYDDPWNQMSTLRDLWGTVESHLERPLRQGVDVGSLHRIAVETCHSHGAIDLALVRLERAQVRMAAQPRDTVAVAAVRTSILQLESVADRHFMAALPDDRFGRLDAGLALLSTVAARAARVRTSMAARRR